MTEAIEAYLADNEEKASAKALRSRLNHVLDYIATLPDQSVQAAAIDDRWVGRFRAWLTKQPIVSPTGKERQRSLSTVETSVAQLAAAINHAHETNQILKGANFKLIPFKDINQTPKHRSDVEELAAMFCYAQGYPSLHRFLAISVATLCRPDAAHDFNVDDQWKGNIINLKRPNTAQTKKVRPEVPAVRQIKPVLDGASGWFVGVKSVRRSWEKMADTLGLPQDREGGMKLIRRSMAALLRGRLPAAEWTELEIWLGHRAISEISALYAPDRPDYLAKCKAGIEAIIDEIEQFVPLAFAGLAPEIELASEAEAV